METIVLRCSLSHLMFGPSKYYWWYLQLIFGSITCQDSVELEEKTCVCLCVWVYYEGILCFCGLSGFSLGFTILNFDVYNIFVFLKAEDRAHRRGQKNAVNVYIFCAKVLLSVGVIDLQACFSLPGNVTVNTILQDTIDESHWKNLNKSLRCVSSATNGKYDAIQEIEVIFLFICIYFSSRYLKFIWYWNAPLSINSLNIPVLFH